MNEKMRTFNLENKKKGVRLDAQTWQAIDWLATQAGAKWAELARQWVADAPQQAQDNLTAAIRSGAMAAMLAANQMPHLDDDSINLLKEIEALTGIEPLRVVAILFPSHLEELHYYLTWLEQLPEGPSKRRTLGLNLLHSYGPELLIDRIKELDPAYALTVTQSKK